MGAFDKCNAQGCRDEQEPPFSSEEIQRAIDLRKHARWTVTRQDQCPHPVACANVTDCLEKIAWYLRHQHAIEAAIASGDTDGYAL